MSLVDKFKKVVGKKSEQQKSDVSTKEKPGALPEIRGSQEEKKSAKKKEVAVKEHQFPSEIGNADRVIIAPLITEKASDLTAKNQYVFKVKPAANANEVKKAVSHLYGVTVEAVRMINLPRKQKRLGRHTGYTARRKKAIVSLKEGDKIETLSQ